jgi:hypothetical protein
LSGRVCEGANTTATVFLVVQDGQLHLVSSGIILKSNDTWSKWAKRYVIMIFSLIFMA